MVYDLEWLLNLLPLPQTLFEVTWTIIGIQFGYVFGKLNGNGGGVDQDIEKGCSRFSWFWQRCLKRALNFLHHYWIGLLLIVYNIGVPELKWLGLGLFLEDGGYELKDILTKLNPLQLKKNEQPKNP